MLAKASMRHVGESKLVLLNVLVVLETLMCISKRCLSGLNMGQGIDSGTYSKLHKCSTPGAATHERRRDEKLINTGCRGGRRCGGRTCLL